MEFLVRNVSVIPSNSADAYKYLVARAKANTNYEHRRRATTSRGGYYRPKLADKQLTE